MWSWMKGLIGSKQSVNTTSKYVTSEDDLDEIIEELEKKPEDEMNHSLLQDAIADAKAVRQQALNNAQQALQNAFSMPTNGWSVEQRGENVIRYKYTSWGNGDTNALDDIEKNGYTILDENEEECWIDVIRPEDLANNIMREDMTHQMAQEITNEIDKEILDKLITVVEQDKEKLKKLKAKYSKFKNYLKSPPMVVDDEHIPSFEEWLKHENESVGELVRLTDEYKNDDWKNDEL